MTVCAGRRAGRDKFGRRAAGRQSGPLSGVDTPEPAPGIFGPIGTDVTAAAGSAAGHSLRDGGCWVWVVVAVTVGEWLPVGVRHAVAGFGLTAHLSFEQDVVVFARA